MTTHTRYRFRDFVVSPRQRQLQRGGEAIPLIPRYFDLLVLLLELRDTAVTRQVIFDRVWTDVIVSDGALSQAIRTLRRTLGDDSREPVFIRTVSRHGYRFVCTDVVEEPDEGPAATPETRPREPTAGLPRSEPARTTFAPDSQDELIDRLLATVTQATGTDDERRDAATRLHDYPLAQVRARLERNHVGAGERGRALALLRDARWDLAEGRDVPLGLDVEGVAASTSLVLLRLRRAARLVARRWTAGAFGAGAAGALAGAVGGAALLLLPSQASPRGMIVLAVVGAMAGAVGAAGIGAGLVAAEAVARSARTASLVVGGAGGGLFVGTAVHVVARALLEGLFGVHVPSIGGPLDGLVLGAAAGAAYAWATRRTVDGLAAPRGSARLATMAAVAAATGLGALALGASGRPLVGGVINQVARASASTDANLAPLGRLLGDPGYGTTARAFWGAFEGVLFGLGLAWGLTRRPRR
ncbi:MAG: winged helix-turn-helix domain-containing protein [Vicinamibacterales bacterium]